MIKTAMKNRKRKDKATTAFVYSISSIAILIFILIIGYVIFTGGSLLSIDLITGDYESINTDVYTNDKASDFNYNGTLESNEYFSKSWGIVLKDDKDKEGNKIVVVTYIDDNSPLKNAYDKNNIDENGNNLKIEIPQNITIEKAELLNDGDLIFALSKQEAKKMQELFDSADTINSLTIQKEGGGVRGSILTTLALIGLTLVIAIPFGVSTAIYLNEYAKKNKFNQILRSLIETLTGIPSIIYGLLGAAVFIPFVNGVFNSSGGSIISGVLTMSVILLPVIIKSTEEALKIVPIEARTSSLALGASKTQTIFKVVIPSAIPGILTGVLLSVGRIIGESAALIYAIGAVVKDKVILTERSTTLAVHIWTSMSGEAPNFELACAIAIIILFVVIILNIIVKIIAKKLNKAWY